MTDQFDDDKRNGATGALNRRQFLRRSAATGATLTAGSVAGALGQALTPTI